MRGLVWPVSVVGVALMAAASAAFVSVNDRCSLPTPYPPSGAGAGVANHGDFEGPFANGVAAQWTAFKDPTYTGQVHFAGTDAPFPGTNAQKLVLPQPPPTYSDQEAGVYQQIWVVPGASYTATCKIYLDAPPAQQYNGEDLVAWVGLDPFGEASGNGGGMKWSVSAATPDQWITATTTVTAVLPVMTLSLKGTRKFPQHGNEARVWFDEVTLTGPVPEGTPPGPEPDPIDPESLIPGTSGPNLVANPSFEQAFSNGVSAGWSKWSTAGTGTWKRSQRIGKIGGGRYDCGSLDALGQMNPKTILLYGGRPHPTNPNDAGANGVYGDIAYLTDTFPQLEDAIFIGRPAIDDNWVTYRTNPAFYGRQLADQLWIKQQQFPRFDCWQGVNEPDWGDGWQTVLAFEKAFAERAHELGMKVCALNLSTGSPGNYWRMVDETFDPSCRDLLEVADYLGHHCYGGPADQLMVLNQVRDDACAFALRPRRFRDMYERRGWRFPPVIATEGSTYFGWHGTFNPATISADLTTMGAYMNANSWWCGYTNFVVGGSCGWSIFEIAGQGTIIPDVGTWNANNPADAREGLYSQMIGAGKVHPRTLSELTPAGQFTGGINQVVNGLVPGEGYLIKCWMKYEFRGRQPTQFKFHLGIDSTGQTTNGGADTIDWGADQIADKAKVHEIFTHVWRTFTATSSTASLWLRASQPLTDPSFMVYVDQVELRQLDDGPAAPSIQLSTNLIEVSTHFGEAIPNGLFTIRNSGVNVLEYTVDEDIPWLKVGPTSGSSTGEADPLTLTYAVTGVAPGLHQGTIVVSASEANNSPQIVAVNLLVLTVRPDFDQDGDVDQSDFGHLQLCLSGPGVIQPSTHCLDADLDNDDDVDQDDFGLLQDCISGAGRPARADCMD
jgi:hypothetical protein